MIKNLFSFLIILFFFSFSFFQPALAADNAIKQFNASMNETGNMAGYTTNNEAKNLPSRIGKILNIAYLGALGMGFLGLMIYAGYTWMLARGNEQEVQKALSTIKNAVIGLLIALAAYGIAAFIGKFVIDAGVTKQ